jgi:hypothetical protein
MTVTTATPAKPRLAGSKRWPPGLDYSLISGMVVRGLPDRRIGLASSRHVPDTRGPGAGQQA